VQGLFALEFPSFFFFNSEKINIQGEAVYTSF